MIAVLATVVLAGSIGGVALAHTEGDEESSSEVRCEALLEKACENYEEITGVSIDCEALETAFQAARDEMRPEAMPNRVRMNPEAMLEHLEALLEEGKITDEQFAKMKDRMESMPDNLPGFRFRGHGGFRGFCEPPAPPTTE